MYVFYFLRAFLLQQIVQPEEVAKKTGLGFPHTTHCLANGEVMISSLGKPNGEGEGQYYEILTGREMISTMEYCLHSGFVFSGSVVFKSYTFMGQEKLSLVLS